jgi:hypothetical protein
MDLIGSMKMSKHQPLSPINLVVVIGLIVGWIFRYCGLRCRNTSLRLTPSF